jgi:hypothetical protein
VTNTDIHPRTPVEIAAQLWCLPQHSSKEMDITFAESIAGAIENEQRKTDAWYETAAQHCRNESYYRDLVVKIGEMIGDAAYICDDGSRSQDVLCAKVPDLVRALVEAKATVSHGREDVAE